MRATVRGMDVRSYIDQAEDAFQHREHLPPPGAVNDGLCQYCSMPSTRPLCDACRREEKKEKDIRKARRKRDA